MRSTHLAECSGNFPRNKTEVCMGQIRRDDKQDLFYAFEMPTTEEIRVDARIKGSSLSSPHVDCQNLLHQQTLGSRSTECYDIVRMPRDHHEIQGQ
jgi:hypothetical protein